MTQASPNVVTLPGREQLSFERLQAEPARAFEGFAVYRDLGPARSLRRVVQEQGKSRALIERWSVRWNWVERARLWDIEVDRQLRAENIARARQDADGHHKIGGLVLARLVERLRSLDADKIPLTAIPSYLEAAVRVQRLATGVDQHLGIDVALDSVPREITVRFVQDWHQLQSEE